MSSSRLPGKVMMPLLGQPMIGRQIERIRRARSLEQLIVATSTSSDDDALADFVQSLGVGVVRGSLEDVLDRFEQAASQTGAQTVVRLTADCPLMDWRLIDACVEQLHARQADYASNGGSVRRSVPVGMDVEALTREALHTAWREATDPYEREHVTPFLYRRPERFRLVEVQHLPDLSHRRWTVDTTADLTFVEAAFAALYPAYPDFGIADIEAFELAHPALSVSESA